jgi:hypothetical protein
LKSARPCFRFGEWAKLFARPWENRGRDDAGCCVKQDGNLIQSCFRSVLGINLLPFSR